MLAKTIDLVRTEETIRTTVSSHTPEQAALYARGLERIESVPERQGGEPVFKSTRTLVRQVGAQYAKGDSLDLILRSYSHLSEEDIEFAKLFWQADFC